MNNIVLVKFLGVCPFLGISKNIKSAGMFGLAAAALMVFSSAVSWSIYHLFLKPFGLENLTIIIFIFTLAILIEILDLIMHKYFEKIHSAIGIYFPILATNCAIVGIAFLTTEENYSLIHSLIASAGAGVGFILVLLIMSSIREKTETMHIPEPFKGLPLAFIIAAVLAMALMGFGGLAP